MKHGFSFIEVMLAMLILTVTVTSISQLQFRSLTRVQRNDNLIEKIGLIKQRLLAFVLDDKKRKQLESMRPHITKDEETGIKITTQLIEINKKSNLAPLKDLISIIQTEAAWSYEGSPRQEKMISFVLQPPKKEEA
ncbi:MAG: prepilin-type N-terminal cleavage/methylation domain-containing protein [Candidatus Babeliales bacterium]|jgi:prepilin-type N-terminal cleavage/methylation domain-containing protein